ncbi:aldehyde dehydrogenase family protein [Actinomadura rubrisoli]|uniref:aldehyde dehydrogenase family protein n=1 Tax=Actinomadura rubrisoli TaxID=2530368 RepID=UPI001FB69865|nr:aldehyde dehydrogenase family protein [Actinomadura rubrisoli]
MTAPAFETVHNVVNGRLRPAADGRATDLVDPCTGEVFGSAPLSGERDVHDAYAAAVEAFDVWRATPPGRRQRALLHCAELLERRADEFVAAECRNTGKPVATTRTEEVFAAADCLRFFAGATSWRPPSSPG